MKQLCVLVHVPTEEALCPAKDEEIKQLSTSKGLNSDLFSMGLHRLFCSYCSLLLTSKTAGEGSRQRGSSVANSN